MMVTNRCTSPTSTIALRADAWTHITTVPSVRGLRYWVSAEVNVTGGTISIVGTQGEISARQRVRYAMTIDNTYPVSMCYHVKSGSPTVTVTNILICSFDEYQANKAVLDSLQYFTGYTMPLA